jgi:TRAP-type C4-dicarboxylate transport system permease large subunit
VLIIVAMSAAFAWVLTISRIPQNLTLWIVALQLSPLAFLFAGNVLLLAFGIFIEPLPGIVVLVPILAPIAHALGINDLHFAIIVIVNLTMGMITPPVGGLLFVASIVARVPLAKMVGELWGRFCGRRSACLCCYRWSRQSARCCRPRSDTAELGAARWILARFDREGSLARP